MRFKGLFDVFVDLRQTNCLTARRLDATNCTINELGNHRMQLDRIFDALASRPRREILAYLSKAELTTTELAERFSMSTPAISRHLSVLENAGLVRSERQGQRVLYALVPDNLVNTLTGFAFEVCPVGGPLKRESRALAKRRKAKAT